MGYIFPLSVPGRIVLLLIAITLGLIWSYFMWPDFWRKILRKEQKQSVQQQQPNGNAKQNERRKS